LAVITSIIIGSLQQSQFTIQSEIMATTHDLKFPFEHKDSTFLKKWA